MLIHNYNNITHNFKYLASFGIVWVSFLLLAILAGAKTFSLGPLVLTTVVLFYPINYIFADIFTEVYGYKNTRKIIWSGYISIMLVTLIGYLYAIIPGSASFTNNQEFDFIFKASPIIALTAIIGSLLGEFTNSYVVAKMKLHYKGKYMGTRFITSTFFGQLVDNTVYGILVHILAGLFLASELVMLITTAVIFCTLWEIVALPLTVRVVKFIKQKEGLDIYDENTSFNIFSGR